MKPLSEAFSPEVMAELARPFRTFDPRDAEFTEDVEARWYVVSIFSRDAEIELAKRRFGIFVPVVDETIIVRGRKVVRHVPVVAGYVFVFLWETDTNWMRVARTPRVDKILGWVTDEEIDKLRFQENCEQIDADAAHTVTMSVVRAARQRLGRKRRKGKQRGKRNSST